MLRDALRGSNPAATPEGFAQWLKDCGGAPNSYCSGNVLAIPESEDLAQEVARRRHATREIVRILTSADNLKGSEREAFVKQSMQELQQSLSAVAAES
jgi:hypothetical protein